MHETGTILCLRFLKLSYVNATGNKPSNWPLFLTYLWLPWCVGRVFCWSGKCRFGWKFSRNVQHGDSPTRPHPRIYAQIRQDERQRCCWNNWRIWLRFRRAFRSKYFGIVNFKFCYHQSLFKHLGHTSLKDVNIFFNYIYIARSDYNFVFHGVNVGVVLTKGLRHAALLTKFNISSFICTNLLVNNFEMIILYHRIPIAV